MVFAPGRKIKKRYEKKVKCEKYLTVWKMIIRSQLYGRGREKDREWERKKQKSKKEWKVK